MEVNRVEINTTTFNKCCFGQNLKTHFSSSPETSACILLQSLWFNKYIEIKDNHVSLANFATKVINFLTQLFEEGNLKPWDDLKLEYSLTNETSFQWLQSKTAVPHKWCTKLNRILIMLANFLSNTVILLKGCES